MLVELEKHGIVISGVKGFLDVQEKGIRGKASSFTVLQKRV